MEDKEKDSGFKIADRRRFDDAGNLRDQGSTTQTPRPSDKVEKVEVAPDTEINTAQGGTAASDRPGVSAHESAQAEQAYAKVQTEQGGGSEQDINFVSFVVSLAHSAMVQLGEIPAPNGVEIPVNKQAAKQTIDILAMISEKTAGNLSDEEERMLEEILHNLRMSFVRAASNRS